MAPDARRTHYQRLGVRPDAPVDAIRAAYRTRARALHPDHRGSTGGGADADGEMAAVNEAWQVLRDPDRRRRYDASLRAAAPRPVASPSGSTRTMGGSMSWLRSGASARATTAPGLPMFGERVVRGGPWLLLVVVLVAIFVFTAFAGRGGRGAGGSTGDGLVEVGSYVKVVEGRTVAEVDRSSSDGRVEAVRASTEPCPQGLESYALPSGPGRVCVRRR